MTQDLKLASIVLLQELDHIQLERAQLQSHNANALNKQERLIYAGMIANVLIADGELSEQKSRLFQLLLNALNLNGQIDRVFDTAKHINKQYLFDFFEILEQHQLKRSFFVDVIVLCRLDGNLTLSQQKILAELIEALTISSGDIELIQTIVACILDLNANPILSKATDLEDIRCWHEFLYRPLTNEIVAQGISGGFWIVDNAICINTGWQMENAYCRFTKTGSIVSENGQEVKIQHCKLFSPVMSFSNTRVMIQHCHVAMPLIDFSNCTRVAISDSKIQGVYASADKTTAMKLYSVSSASFKSLHVTTTNARAFYLYNSPGNFDSCDFVECGHPDLVGGAIAFNGRYSELNVKESTFNRCIARIGGGIKINALHTNTVSNCQFYDCVSSAKFLQDDNQCWDNTLLGGGGIFSDEITSNISDAILDSRFERSTINLGIIHIANNKLIVRCTFNNANFTYKWPHSFIVSKDSIFSNIDEAKNIPLFNQLEHQAWWSQYE
ncbi:hypothetical protein [Undibacterium sp. WLX3042]|uniref:hypothetical protein n=1 Tax=Undibacterium sp. WLX3042 TaxID=3412686 RepID=UPI003C2EA489